MPTPVRGCASNPREGSPMEPDLSTPRSAGLRTPRMWDVLHGNSPTRWNLVERLIYPAPAPSYTIASFQNELILIPRTDGESVPCLLLPFRHARFLFIYFHANAEDLGLCHSFCKIMRDLFQVHVLSVEYPGYGICGGKTDEAGIVANARAAMSFALEVLKWPCDGIKLFGRSLGTGPAVALAAQHLVAGVILVSPFTSIRSLFRSQVGPLADLVEDRFPNEKLVSQIRTSTLIIHGQQDTLIPPEHGRRLYDQLTTRKMMVCPATMGHNTSLLKNVGTFVLPMTQFFSLPDYTFEDLEVPQWVFPCNDEWFADAEHENQQDDKPDYVTQTQPCVGVRIAQRGGASRGLLSPRLAPSAKPSSDISDEESAFPSETFSGGDDDLGPAASGIAKLSSNTLQASRSYSFASQTEMSHNGDFPRPCKTRHNSENLTTKDDTSDSDMQEDGSIRYRL